MKRKEIAAWLEAERPVESELKKYYMAFQEPVSPDWFLKRMLGSHEESEAGSDGFDHIDFYLPLPAMNDFGLQEETVFSDQYWTKSAEEILIQRHLRYSPPMPHSHEFVELAYVYKGSCRQTFLYKNRPPEEVKLEEGMLCILPPGTVHEIAVFDESTVVNILIRADVMRESLPDLVVGNHMLYDFFLHALFHADRPGYLIFDTKNSDQIKNLVLDMMAELCEIKCSVRRWHI